jgi:hypothetical protein
MEQQEQQTQGQQKHLQAMSVPTVSLARAATVTLKFFLARACWKCWWNAVAKLGE